MRHSTQLSLIERINAHREAGRGTDTAASTMRVPVADYTSASRLTAEKAVIHSTPSVVGLSGLLPDCGSYATVDMGDRSVVVTRDSTGAVHALANVCRHRGAEVARGCGSAQRLSCPYHGWVYELDGSAVSRRRGEHFDGDLEPMVALACVESNGLIWANPDPQGTIGPEPLAGAEAELGPFGLDGYELFASTTFERRLNWKLAVDTFCEAYHLSSLHKATLAPLIYDDFALFDEYGMHGRMIAVRKSFLELDDVAPTDRTLLPHATILYFLVPNTVLIYQQDHVQLYQSRPGDSPDEAHLSVNLYVPPDSTRSESYWQKNFDLLVSVTDSEDFAAAAGIQRGAHSGAQDEFVFGRNEPALQHYHRSIDALVSQV